MVSIVIPKDSLPDLINAGLTVRHYNRKGEEAKVYLISEVLKEKFWKEIRRYADKRDRSLIVLNFPLPSEETLKKISLRPYEYSILYIPSELISMTPQSKKILLEKGIVFMPQRSIYKCFPGEYIDKIERKWMKINEILSFENASIDEKYIDTIKGLLKVSGKNPLQAIERIAEDDLDFFDRKSEETFSKTLKHIKKPNFEIWFTGGKGIDLIQAALHLFLSSKKTPIGIKGKKESAIITESSTFADHIFNKYDIKAKHKMKFGKGAAILTDFINDVDMGFLVGGLSHENIIIEFGHPKFVVKKTLLRKLVGGTGPNSRMYIGLKSKYPNIEIKKNYIKTPRAAIENVIDTLRETGTEFKIIS